MSVVTDDVKIATKLISSGHLCAIPTETVYGLAAAASNPDAIKRVFEAKGRPLDHPLIVHVADFERAMLWVSNLPDWAKVLADSCWPGPLTLVANRSSLASDLITGGQDTVAVRVPNHPKTLELLKALADAGIYGVVAPSANLFGQVSPTNATHVLTDLGEYLLAHDDGILDGGSCQVGIESTIVLATSNVPRALRPGVITDELIESITGLAMDHNEQQTPRVSGALASHYAPKAKVHVLTDVSHQNFQARSGFIALQNIPTPDSLIRLATPIDVSEFAACLYEAMRQADTLNLENIYIITPQATGIGEAIIDRVTKAAHEKSGGR